MPVRDDERFEGIEVETPVGSFRAGKGGRMDPEDEDYLKARRKVRRVMGFYRHLTTFVTVILVLLAIDVATGTDSFFVQWVALVWGIILALHFLNVWVFESIVGTDAERRMIEHELRKRQGRRQ
jgi:hypothetical protein